MAAGPDFGFESDRYNRLATVESAYQELLSRDCLQVILDESGELFRRHSMGGFGLFLIHSHFRIEQDERIVERRIRLADGEEALLAKAAGPHTASPRDLPSRWALDPGPKTFRALEFSQDDFVENGMRILGERPAFLTELAALLLRHEVSDLIGLSVARREGMLLGKGESYVETTDIERMGSLLRRLKLINRWPKEDKTLIPTVWTHEDGDCWCEPQITQKCLAIGDMPHEVIRLKTGHEKVPCA